MAMSVTKTLPKEVPIDRNDFDGSLGAVLDDIKMRNANYRRLVDYKIQQDSVLLTYKYEE